MLRRILAAMSVVSFFFISAPSGAKELSDLPVGLQLYVQAQKKVSAQKYDAAVSLFSQALEVSETKELKHLAATGILNSHLAAGFYFQNSPEKVIYHLTEALKLKPSVSNAWDKKGHAHCELKQYQACDDAFSMAIKHSEAKYRHLAIWTRAMMRHEMGQRLLAAKDFAAAAKAAHDVGDLTSAKGFLLSAASYGYKIDF